MTITVVTSGIVGLLTLVLMVNVSRYRRAGKISLGTGDSGSKLERAVRAHGNLMEFAPLFLILLGSLEYMKASPLVLTALAALFITARLLHGYGLGFTDGSLSFGRFWGTLLTMLSLLIASVYALMVGFAL